MLLVVGSESAEIAEYPAGNYAPEHEIYENVESRPTLCPAVEGKVLISRSVQESPTIIVDEFDSRIEDPVERDIASPQFLNVGGQQNDFHAPQEKYHINQHKSTGTYLTYDPGDTSVSPLAPFFIFYLFHCILLTEFLLRPPHVLIIAKKKIGFFKIPKN